MLPYIGVSKLSCAFCELYFAAYRDYKGVKAYTHGTRGQATPWMCPASPEDDGVKALFCVKLRGYIKDRLYDEKVRRNAEAEARRKASMHSESMVSSEDCDGKFCA